MGSAAKFFLFNRWADTGIGTITSSGELGGFPASYTQDQARGRTWRSSSLTSPFLKRDLGAAYNISAVVVVDHNLTTSATLRVRVSNNSDMSAPLFDSGNVNAWEAIYSASEITKGKISEYFTAGGLPLAAAISALQEPIRIVSFTQVSGRYIQVDFSDSGNADGFIEVAYVFAGVMVEADPNIIRGWTVVRDEIARMPQASSGQYWMGSVLKRIHLDAELAPQKETDAFDTWMLMFRLLGNRREMIIRLIEDNGAWKYYTTVYCKFVSAPGLENAAINSYPIPLRFEEVL